MNESKCTDTTTGCQREARMALRTKHGKQGSIDTTAYWDDRVAPKVAQRYCREHGLAVLADLGKVLVTPDTEPTEEQK